MKKILTVICIITVVLSLGGCKPSLEKQILGHWKLTEESKSVNQSAFYPEVDELTFHADGSWNDEEGNVYTVSDNQVTMSARGVIHPYTYNVEIKNDILMLQYPGAEPLYFELVKD